MIKKEEMTVKSVTEIAQDTFEMVLKNDYISQHANPGQFLHISVPNLTLRRPISIAYVDEELMTVTIIFKRVGEGTSILPTYSQGMMIDAMGPSGHGFPVDHVKTSALLIGGGVGIPPLYFLAKQLYKTGIKVYSILGFQTEQAVFYEEEFARISNTFITTDDGSYGEKGLVTAIIPKIKSFNSYYTCGPLPMMRAVKEAIPHVDGYLSFEERMGCGVGTCLACVIPSNDEQGYKKICQDGPVFRANEVII